MFIDDAIRRKALERINTQKRKSDELIIPLESIAGDLGADLLDLRKFLHDAVGQETAQISTPPTEPLDPKGGGSWPPAPQPKPSESNGDEENPSGRLPRANDADAAAVVTLPHNPDPIPVQPEAAAPVLAVPTTRTPVLARSQLPLQIESERLLVLVYMVPLVKLAISPPISKHQSPRRSRIEEYQPHRKLLGQICRTS